MSLIQQLCTYLVKEKKLDPMSENDRMLLHIICFQTLFGSRLNISDIDDITVNADIHGPYIPLVEEWCDSLVKYTH